MQLSALVDTLHCVQYRTPFFLRFTAAILLGLFAGFETSPGYICFLLPLIFLQKHFIIYTAAFLSGYALVQPSVPDDVDFFLLRIVEKRSPHFAFAEIQGYRANSTWRNYNKRKMIFSRDSLPDHGTLLCRGDVNVAYNAFNINDFALIAQDTTWLESWRSNVRKRLSNRIHPDALAISQGIFLGDKSGLSGDTYDLYKHAGGAHILAVSGLHVGMVYGMILLILYPVGNRPWARILKVLLTLLILWGYAAVTGFSPSVIRASGFCTLLSLTRHRGANMYHTLALLLFLALVWEPESLYAVGLQLSYLAVLGILLFQPIIEKYLIRIQHPYQWMLRSFAVSLSAQLASYPLVAFYFGGISVAGLFTSVFLIPYAFTVIVLVVIILFSPMPLRTKCNELLLWLIELVQSSLEQIVSWPFAFVRFEIQSLLPYYALLILSFAAIKWPGKRSLFLLLMGLIFVLARH